MSQLEWRVLFDGPRPAAAQMSFDERLASLGVPAVRFFTWHPPAMSLGFKQPLPDWLNPPAGRRPSQGFELVERPTGGGMAFHGSDVSLSVTVPRASALPLDLIMGTVCQSAVRLCRAYGAKASCLMETPVQERITYCLTEPSPYAVLIGGRKVAGFAIRRYPTSWLIQGSLLVRRLTGPLARALPEEVLRRLERDAVPLFPYGGISEREVARHWSERWSSWWEDLVGAQAPPEQMVRLEVSDPALR